MESPPDFSTTISPGDGIYKIWQFGFKPECGNSGLVPIEDMRALVLLIVARGFRTDARLPGVEKIVACEMMKEWYNDSANVPKGHVEGSPVAATSLSEVKGWKRILAAWFVVVAITELGIIEEVRSAQAVFNSFCMVYVNVVPPDLEKNIFTNREVLDVSLRGILPQAHNNLHHQWFGFAGIGTPLQLHQASREPQWMGCIQGGEEDDHKISNSIPNSVV